MLPRRRLLAAALAVIAAPVLRRLVVFADAFEAPVTVNLESQAWWLAAGETGMGRHTHIGAAFPWKETISGVVTFPVTVKLHDNDVVLSHVKLQIIQGKGSTSAVLPDIWLKQGCTTGDCTFTYDLTVDTRTLDYDGISEFRFQAIGNRPNGERMYATTGWRANIVNGKPIANYSSTFTTEARGWYTGTDYANARMDSDLPTAPLSGVWAPKVALWNGGSGVVTGHSVHVDPDFHHGSEGTVIKQGAGEYRGTVSIDTATLAAGAHKLVLITHKQIATGRDSGVLVVPFAV